MENQEDLVLFSPQIETFTPFACYVDASRLNMASKQQTQVVIGPNTDTPFVIDKNYKNLSEVSSPFAEFAVDDGHILLSDYETIILYYTNLKKLVTKSIPSFKKMVNNSLSLKYKADVGPIKKGELLFDYTGMDSDTHLPKIGYRSKIMFSSFFGYTADDALVISESFSKKAKVSYTQKIFIPITKEWKYLRNDEDNYFFSPGSIMGDCPYAKYFPIDTSDHFMAEIHNLSPRDSLFFTKNIKGISNGKIENIKVHRNTTKSFLELNEEYLYTPGLIQEIEYFYNLNYKAFLSFKQTFKNLGLDDEQVETLSTELYESHYSVPKFTKHFENKLKDTFNLDPTQVDFILEVDISYTADTTRGDKFTNLYAGKGVVSMIIPDELMPINPETGDKIDVIFNPLGIFGRNNWGSIFELALSKISNDIEKQAENNNIMGVIDRLFFIEEFFIRKYDSDYSQKTLNLLNTIIDNSGNIKDEVLADKLISDINSNGFYLFAPNFPGISYKDFYTNFIKPYAKNFNINPDKTKIKLNPELIRWLREKWHYQNNVFEDDVYEKEILAFVGSNYWLKLHHTSYSKYTSVSFANSYSKITGQPTRGRKKQGGQHISWQTLAALLAHKENNSMMKELYTIKSDSIVSEKEAFILKYVTAGKYKLKPKYSSLTKRAVNTALQLIGMEFED